MAAVWDSEDVSGGERDKNTDDGDYRWVFVDEQWIPAKVVRTGGNYVATTVSGSTFECGGDQLFGKVLSLAGLKRLPDNLIHSDDMSEQTIIYLINQKFDSDLIYTSIGDILIAVNPYRLLPLYTPLVMHKYMKEFLDMNLRPHPYSLVRRSYDHMLEHGLPQSILISGESGAGKTETTKLCLSFLSELAAEDAESSQGMEQKILASNPILESFGNAKTLRNHNSSRYGKYINLIFSKTGVLQGCETKNFLLEKSRVHMQAFGERSYHIFYQLCRAAVEEADCFSMDSFGDIMKRSSMHEHMHESACSTISTMRTNLASLGLKHPDEFNYLNQSGCLDIYLVSDQENFHEMEFAATKLGFSNQQLNAVFSVCACVLHLGNLSFDADEDSGQSFVCPAPECDEALSYIAKLLDVGEEDITTALTTRELKTRGEVTRVLLTVSQATESRNALAKALYTRCFDFLIEIINIELSVEAFQGRRASECVSPTAIGILDIYGFEVFEMNGFEQLFINYANEKLQQHFNSHTFEEEIKACERENISCEDFTYLDNQETLNLFESNSGILKILDDECKFPKGTDEAFLNKLKTSQKNNDLISFTRKFSDLGFDIAHYAGSVNYTVKEFLEKNKDKISDDLDNLMSKSSISFLSPRERARTEDIMGRAKTKQLTVAGKFKKDLDSLLMQLNASVPHFIRCIKPNEEKEPGVFHHSTVHRQLKQSGAFDALSIRKRGYQFQFPHAIFLQRYRPIALKYMIKDSNRPLREKCMDLITSLSTINGMKSLPKNMQVGESMVFWKSAEDVKLSELRKRVVNEAVLVLQRFCRGGVIRCHFIQVNKHISESKGLLKKHEDIIKSRELVTFDSECEIFQQLTLHKDFFETSDIRPYFEKKLGESLALIEERIDCINQLQLHYQKPFKSIDSEWLRVTEKAISLELFCAESIPMIEMYHSRVRNHGNVLLRALKHLESSNDVKEIQNVIEEIEIIRRNEPDFAEDVASALKRNVAIVIDEKKLVSSLLESKNAENPTMTNEEDKLMPFHQLATDNGVSLSNDFRTVLKVVDYVVELRDIVLTTLIRACGLDSTSVPLFPPPEAPKKGVTVTQSVQEDSMEAEELDFNSISIEPSAIVNMSGRVSTGFQEKDLWSSSQNHFQLFQDIESELSNNEDFLIVIELAAQEVFAYKKAIEMCRTAVQDCAAVLRLKKVDGIEDCCRQIDRLNNYVATECKLLTVSSQDCEEQAQNRSHPYFSKLLDLEKRKLLVTQYSMLVELKQHLYEENELVDRVAKSMYNLCLTKDEHRLNEKKIDQAAREVEKLRRFCSTSLYSSFLSDKSDDVCKSADYALKVRKVVNDVIFGGKTSGSALDGLEELLASSNKFNGLDELLPQQELNFYREEVFNIKVHHNNLRDKKQQFKSDLLQAIEVEDEGQLAFLVDKLASEEFDSDSSVTNLVDQAKCVLDKYQSMKSIAQTASSNETTIEDLKSCIIKIENLSCKGSPAYLEALNARLDTLIACQERIHKAWYESPNSVEKMISALQECKNHNFPQSDEVRFVEYLVGLWREDYVSYLKALIDLRTFLEDVETVDELNEELNNIYRKNISEEYDPSDGIRITEDEVQVQNGNDSHRSSYHPNFSAVEEESAVLSSDANVNDNENISLGDIHAGGRFRNDSQEENDEQSSTANEYVVETAFSAKKKKKILRKVPRKKSNARMRSTSDVYIERNEDGYMWYKFPNLRTFADPERERQRKVFTPNNIPTSITRLDNIIHIQLATAAFKCLLGIMGDQIGSYPEMLKKEFLRIATYHSSLTDELYCQVMKQLTRNPNRVSRAKGVDLLQLLVSTVLPTQKLQPYLENFLRSHGALEFVNLLRVLSMKKTVKTEKNEENYLEGWLLITVGKIMKSFRKRWCVLDGDSLSLFLNKDHSSKIETYPISQIKSIQIAKKKDENVKAMYAFDIEMKNKKFVTLYAMTDQDRARWIEKTKAAIYIYWSQGS